ncbi:MAG TPA: ATP-binding cassette domain-containing protein [Allosphingosinicella sp.]
MSAPVLAYENLGLVQGSGWLFRGLDLFIGARDRLALIGRNGAGKTTLLKCLAGMIDPDEGRRTIQPGIKVVLLEQDPDVVRFATLLDFATAGGVPVHAVEAIASQIGIDLERPAATASGGERRRAAIARALAQDPQVLLLDEPTNHLDLAAIEWLEDWLKRFNGAFIAISHDRTFLTRLTRSSLWMDRGALRRAEIGFGGFDAWTEQVFAEEARNAERLDSKLRLEEHWLLRGVTARRKRNQGRLAKLQEMRAARAAMLGPPGVAKLGLANDDAKTKTVIDAEGVTKRFPSPAQPEPVEGLSLPSGTEKKGSPSTSSGRAGEEGGCRTIIRNFSLRVQRGDRIGIVGSNGAGKTTLLRLLTGELEPDEGVVRRARTLTGVMIDQQRKLLDPQKSVRDILADGGDWIEVREVKKHVVGYLKEFLFDPNLVDAKVGTLSGGERSRLLLAREFARRSNLLVLDEPTNDLDLETLDLLQEVIADYDGTVLIVSHDRDFLDKTVTITLGLDGSGNVDIVAGGYEDWVRQRKERSETSRSSRAKSRGAGTDSSKAPLDFARDEREMRRPAKLTYKDQRDYELLPRRVEELEAAIARDEAALADPDLYTRDPQRFAALMKAIEAAQVERSAAEERWLELAEQVEALAS